MQSFIMQSFVMPITAAVVIYYANKNESNA